MAESMIAVPHQAAILPKSANSAIHAHLAGMAEQPPGNSVPVRPPRQMLSDTPAVISPEPASVYAARVPAAVRMLASMPGVVSAWLHPAALEDRVPGTPDGEHPAPEIMLVVLAEPGCEASVACGEGDGAVLITLMSEEMIRDALEWDDELALVLATGYRLCGPEREAFELESLAREIAGVGQGGGHG